MMRLQVRTPEGDTLSVEATMESTFASMKESIRDMRGVDVIMMKLICNGRIMTDGATPEMCGISEDDFLVLVTAKPRPPGMMTTAVALPLCYALSGRYYEPDLDDLSEDEVEEDAEGEGAERPTHLASGDSEAAELLPRVRLRLGRASGEADDDADEEEADLVRELAALEGLFEALPPCSACIASEVSIDALDQRLRALPAFGALQEVVRVDPQIMLVLNTEAMQFEDQRSGGQAGPRAEEERDAVEQAFWDACSSDAEAEVPNYDRVRQLLHEVRDTTCALLPSQWEGSEWEEQLVRAAQLHDDLASNVKDVPKSVGEPKGVLPLAPLASYMLGVSEQVSMLAGPSRANEAAAWRDAVEAAALSVHCVPAGGRSVELSLTNDADGEASLAVADAMAKRGTAALVGCGTLSHTPVTHTFDIGPSDEAPAMLLLRFFRSTFGQLQAIKLDLANAQLARLMREDSDLVHIIAAQPADFVSLLNSADGGSEEEGSDGGENEHMCADCGDASFVSALRELGHGQSYNAEGAAYGRYASAAGQYARVREASIGLGAHSAAGTALAVARDLTQPGALGRSSSEESDFELAAAHDARDMEVEGAGAQSHSELMQALMQQWLHTPAGHEATQEATQLRLSPDEAGQFFHARMLQSLERMRLDTPPDLSMSAAQIHQVMESLPAEAEEAVARLVVLGFERGRVIEAYIACDQDEMLAANLLMDQ